MIKRYAFPMGGANTPPPIPQLTISFLLGSFNSFQFNLSRPVDGNIVISRAYVDSKNAYNGSAVGSAQMNTAYTYNAGTSGGASKSPDTTSGDLATPTHYTVYNVIINGNPVLDGATITVGSFTVKVNLTNI